MNIFLTGGTGFVGGYILNALSNAGHNVIAAVRNTESAHNRWPNITLVEADFARDHQVEDWLEKLDGVDVVINAVGIISETKFQSFDALHAKAPSALFHAAEKANVKRIVQISALGVDEQSFVEYQLSKKVADDCLRSLNIDWVILQPSFIYGVGSTSLNFFNAFSAQGVIPLIGGGGQRIQPIYIDDLVQVVLAAIDGDALKNKTIPVVGPHAMDIRSIYKKLHAFLGLGKTRFISIPYELALFASHLGVGKLLGAPQFTSDAIKMLRAGNTSNVVRIAGLDNYSPISFDQGLAKIPAQSSDRWHAGLFFLKPLLRYTIGFLWIFTAIVSAFLFPAERSYALLAKVGVSEYWAPFLLYSAASLNFILGLATLFAYRVSLFGLLQIAVIVIYTTFISIALTEYWYHPFGPVSKNIPIVVAIMIMMVLEKK